MSSAVAAACVALMVFAGCSDGDDGDSDETSTASTATSSSAAIASTAATPSPTAPPSTAPATTVPPTSAPATSAPTTPPVAESGFNVAGIVETLASDGFAGRNDGTEGWRMAQEYLAEQLAAISQPAFAELSGLAGYLHEGPSANVAGIIPGSELPDEYVVIGAHYDGLGDAAGGGEGCLVLDPADTICNGAADNAAGVATVLAVAHKIAESGPPGARC